MAGITKIFWGITLFLIVYSIGFDFPISGDIVLGTWFIFYFIFVFYVINNKTTVVKNPVLLKFTLQFLICNLPSLIDILEPCASASCINC